MSTQAAFPAREVAVKEIEAEKVSNARVWMGRIIQGLTVAFLVMDGGMKLFKPSFVVQATVQMGYPEVTIVPIGAALLLCTLLYVIPRTAFLGAIFLTGYLGGAVASNVRAGTPAFNVIFPFLFAILVWAPLLLRNRTVAALMFQGK